MRIIKHTVETTATPTQVWQVLEDVENWKSWDKGTELSRIDGPFQAGTRGSFRPTGGPLLKILLTHVEPLKLFACEVKFFLAKSVSSHAITQVAGKTQVTFQTEFRGPLAFFFACFLRRSIKKKVPIEMEQMLKKAKALG